MVERASPRFVRSASLTPLPPWGGHAVRRSAIDRPRILDDAGERLISDVFARRSRKHASWGDCAEMVVLALDATGLLDRYTEPGIDPLQSIRLFNEDGG